MVTFSTITQWVPNSQSKDGSFQLPKSEEVRLSELVLYLFRVKYGEAGHEGLLFLPVAVIKQLTDSPNLMKDYVIAWESDQTALLAQIHKPTFVSLHFHVKDSEGNELGEFTAPN